MTTMTPRTTTEIGTKTGAGMMDYGSADDLDDRAEDDSDDNGGGDDNYNDDAD